MVVQMGAVIAHHCAGISVNYRFRVDLGVYGADVDDTERWPRLVVVLSYLRL